MPSTQTWTKLFARALPWLGMGLLLLATLIIFAWVPGNLKLMISVFGATIIILAVIAQRCYAARVAPQLEIKNLISIIEAVPNAIVVIDRQGMIVALNAHSERWFGYDRGELTGAPIETLVPERYRSHHVTDRNLFLTAASHRAMGMGRELFARRKDGSEFPVEIGLSPLTTLSHMHVLASIVDLTERKKSEERFRLVVEAAPNAMLMANATGKIVLVNSRVEAWFGYARSELLGQPVEILVPERYRNHHPQYRQSFMDNAEPRAMGAGRELFGLRKDGSEFPIEIGLNPIQTEDGVMVLSSIIDISERKKSEERFRLVVDAAPNAMVMVNDSGQIVLVNAQVEAWFGYNRNELLEQPVEILVPERYRGHHPHYRQSFMDNAEPRAMGAGRELYGLRKDGSEFPIEIGLNPIQTTDGMLVLSSIIDISERKAIELRFREHAEQVALASRYKSEFLANMSHELRTPLNSILILSEQLHDNAKSNLLPKQVEYADIIHKSGEDLLSLINDILDLSRIEAGHMQIQREKVILAEFGDYLRHAFQPISENKQLDLQCHIEDTLPAVMVLDFQRVYQIIKNLFSNAIKFTNPGGKIHIRFARHDATTPPSLAISVTDTGTGIPADKHDLIFQAFQQLDGSISRKYGGTGLGLAISRQLAELLGGSLGVSSDPGLGSTFTLLLPIVLALEESDKPLPMPSPQGLCAAESPQAGQRVVMIVEDDANFAKVVANCAREHQFSCQLFQSGSEALAAIEHNPPDALIIDLLLPDMSGWQLLEGLQGQNLPTMIISCLDQPSAPRKDVLSYMVKPVDNQKLNRAFELLHTEIERRASIPPNTSTQPAAGHSILLVDDDIRNVYAMSGLLEDAGMRVSVARNGEEALDIIKQTLDIELILMDMMMPVLDGYQTTARLRRDLHFTKPILAVTALAMKGDREKCLAAGADDYLAKPVKRTELLAMIDRLLIKEGP